MQMCNTPSRGVLSDHSYPPACRIFNVIIIIIIIICLNLSSEKKHDDD
jgi:hypothetical protein